MTSGYQVEHPKLKEAGGQLGEHGGGIQELQQHLQEAKVPTKAWGLLGLSTGLFEIYLTMLNDLEQHLNQMGAHITTMGDIMKQVAEEYEQNEKEISGKLGDIVRKLEENSRPPILTAGGEGGSGGSVTPGVEV